ncbi:Pr6Pr family membrane protein [Agrococcus baldri]|uniref:Pr6Pr family membrane protein n=1 Tax=Agrococcus baldri TaxID=153730 RepID=A0AA87RFC4_9MICO|nr:Pr6Pr family membrane protein [Agrococcus baldri]GEK81681.1 hypothetical protein ABA31_30320 [Agrococcus baldri]
MTVAVDMRTRNNAGARTLLIGRTGAVALILSAVIAQLVTSVTFWSERGAHDLGRNIITYLSFFTVESNILAAALLTALLVAQLGRLRLGRRFDVLLLGATAYMVLTGAVYNATMRDVALPASASLEWANEVLHVVAPAWMLLDWIISSRERRLRWRDLGTVAVFPALWLGCTLLRAPRTPEEAIGNPYWYPQLDPASYETGAFGVVTTCLGITVALLLITGALLAHAAWRARMHA